MANANAVHLPGFEPEPELEPKNRAGEKPAAKPTSVDEAPVAVDVPARLPFTVEVIRSRKRKRSVGAQLIGDTLKLTIPSWMSKAEEAHWIDEMSKRFLRKMSTDRFDLTKRTAGLAKRLGLRTPTDIRWATDMTQRWGSCTPTDGTIRISDRLAAFPDWVVDYVIVHELAHLEVPDHGADFWALVHRFPTAERAVGYLIAKSGEDE
jgi:predicted metal-dependent hydrolase